MRDNTDIETLVDRYIRENGLTEGSSLPPNDQLATLLQCDIATLVKAIHIAEKQGRVIRDASGRVLVMPPPILSDHHAFSFTRSAQAHGESLVTTLIEAKQRLPLDDPERPLSPIERRAQIALGLGEQAEFVVIVRGRVLHEKPSALHRVYLDPARFPHRFWENHNLESESLINIYRQYGFELLSRDTVLTARLANLFEDITFRKMDRNVHGRAVLDAEQKMFARHRGSQDVFVLEFLQASYFDWRYEIKNRPAPLASA